MSGVHARIMLGLLLSTAFCVQCQRNAVEVETAPRPTLVRAVIGEEFAGTDYAYDQLARRDPLGFMRIALERCQAEVRDYTCTFIKQELVQNRMTKQQHVEVQFRSAPYSVNMHWVRNASRVERAIYETGRWSDRKGRPQAVVKPQGALLQLIVPGIKQPIHSRDAEAESRRTIDEFGFQRSLELIIQYAVLADDRSELEFVYKGDKIVDGRLCYEFERRLPYDSRDETYPDRILDVCIDKEWLLPLACYSWGDDNRQVLLGKYVFSDVKLNVGLDDNSFNPKKYGM